MRHTSSTRVSSHIWSSKKGRWAIKPAIVKLQHALAGLKNAPKEPLHVLRDVWPGDVERAAHLLTGNLSVDGKLYTLILDKKALSSLPAPIAEEISNFLWLRDLACLGTEEARLYARAAVAKWIDQPFNLMDDAVCGATRLCAIVGHYEFFARTADETFRRRLMRYLQLLGRMLPLAAPVDQGHWSALSVIRGLMVAAFYLPGLSFLRERALRNLEKVVQQLIYPDGTVCQRSPYAQFQVVRELTEMSAILRMAQQPVSDVVMVSMARLCPVLRAMRHGDGGVALFNGGWAHDGDFVERVIQYAGRQKVVAPKMLDGLFTRLTAGKMLLLVDNGSPPAPGFDADAHNAPLSFEFSTGRDRVFVNCGSSRLPVWDQLLRQSAAHNSLVTEPLARFDAADTRHKLSQVSDPKVTATLVDDHPEIDLTYTVATADGPEILTWHRNLRLARDGLALIGRDIINGPCTRDFVVRFHLAPAIEVEKSRNEQECILRSPTSRFSFTQDGAQMTIEESVYFGNGHREGSSQLVLRRLDFRPPDKSSADMRQSDLFVHGSVSDVQDPLKARMNASWKLTLI